MTAYRQNAWRPPETTPAPRLTRCERLLEWCWVTLVQPLLCREGYHRLHQHTYALGWCRACHRPLVWKRATESLRPNGTLVAPDGWHEISVTLGNSFPEPVIRWIGKRIEIVDDMESNHDHR